MDSDKENIIKEKWKKVGGDHEGEDRLKGDEWGHTDFKY